VLRGAGSRHGHVIGPDKAFFTLRTLDLHHDRLSPVKTTRALQRIHIPMEGQFVAYGLFYRQAIFFVMSTTSLSRIQDGKEIDFVFQIF
jgi:hypothetical protein